MQTIATCVWSAGWRRVPVQTVKSWENHSDPGWLDLNLVAKDRAAGNGTDPNPRGHRGPSLSWSVARTQSTPFLKPTPPPWAGKSKCYQATTEWGDKLLMHSEECFLLAQPTLGARVLMSSVKE